MYKQKSKIKKILLTVCHPDDEALWFGGLLYELSRFKNLEIYVICISGGGGSKKTVREKEFLECKNIANYKDGIVIKGELNEAIKKLENISGKINSGLKKLNLNFSMLDLIITHSPYGDEHRHPHHIQMSKEIFNLSRNKKIPFGFFSCLPLPRTSHIPYLRTMISFNKFDALNFSKCKYNIFLKIIKFLNFNAHWFPEYYTQWRINKEIKLKMLACYESTDLEKFESGYLTFNSNIENLYLYDRRGVMIFEDILKLMSSSEVKDLFTSDKIKSIKNKLKSKIKFIK